MLSSTPPVSVPVPFANSGTKNTIPVPSQIGTTPGAASYTDGFPPLTFTPVAAGGIPPFGADFNGILNMITQTVAWVQAGGEFAFNATFAGLVAGYPKGAVLQRSDATGSWTSTVDSNTVNPDTAVTTAASGWVPYGTSSALISLALTNGNVTLTALQAARNIIVLSGTLTGNVQLIMPTGWAGVQWSILNQCVAGNFSVTVKTAAGTGVVIAAGSCSKVLSDGTNCYSGDVGGRLLTITIVNTAGTTAFTPNPLANRTEVELQGSGGAGGGTPATSSSQSAAASGGCSGSYARIVINGPISGNQSIILGAPGVGVAGGAGGSGGNSAFGTFVTCPGGPGAFVATAVSSYPSFGLQSGFTVLPSILGATTVGEVLSVGTAGAIGIMAGLAYSIAGTGGASPVGQPGPGLTPSGPGCGGSGNGSLVSQSAKAGFPGALGFCLVREYS
jgi:hypothetical protein